jgi:type I restriction enzyme S subunit
MIEGLKPHSAYKDSGVPWLGEVPEQWEILRSKRLFAARKEFAALEDVQLSATQAYGVIPQSEFERRVGRRVVRISMHLEKRRHVEKDDFVISMRSFQGGLERAWAEGAIRSSYVVLKAQRGVDVGFFAHLFKSHCYIRALQSTADFIRDGQDLNFSNFSSVDLPLPPIDEQAAMGRFLDHANRRIDRFIRAKRKLILAASEVRASMTEEVVRSSIVPYSRLSSVATLVSRPVNREMGRSYVRLGLKNRGRGIFHKSSTPSEHLGASDFFWVEPGDLVISGQFAWEGAVAIASQGDRGCIVSHRYPVVQATAGVAITPYLWAFLRSGYGDLLLDVNSRGAAGRNRPLNEKALLKEKIPVPPLEAQKKVADVVASEAEVRSSVERQIAVIQEYRTRLVADVVTGQLDVREAAARLPADEPDTAGEELASEADQEEDIEPEEMAE